MMVAVFGTMLLALLLGALGFRPWAIGTTTIGLGFSIWLFLFEVYSSVYGFSMPWINL